MSSGSSLRINDRGVGSVSVDENGNRTIKSTYYDEYGNQFRTISYYDKCGRMIDFKKEEVWGSSIGYTTSKNFSFGPSIPNPNNCYSSHPIDFKNAKPYNEKNYFKGDSNMSLVGLVRCYNGIVGFGDYKSTKLNENGVPTEEKERVCQKVFKNNKFIMATFGVNEVITAFSQVRLEDYIKEHLKDDTECEEFFHNFANDMAKTGIIYNFLVGKKMKDNYCLFQVNISKERMETLVAPMDKNSVYGGQDKYYKAMSEFKINPANDVEDAAKIIDKAVKALIEFYSFEDEYQSVGTNSKGEICIEIFK